MSRTNGVEVKCQSLISSGRFACVGNRVILPINVLCGQMNNVALRAAQMPAEFVEAFSFRILLAFDDQPKRKRSFIGCHVQPNREEIRSVTVLRACWRALARFGVRREVSARFGARHGTLLWKNLGAEALRFGGEGRNRTGE